MSLGIAETGGDRMLITIIIILTNIISFLVGVFAITKSFMDGDKKQFKMFCKLAEETEHEEEIMRIYAKVFQNLKDGE